MDYTQAVVLAAVQGVTEWLPISSSGHLAVLQHLMGVDVPVAFDVMLHLGTLLAVILFMRADLASMVGSIYREGVLGRGGRLVLYIFLATLPAGAAGLAFKHQFESFFSNMGVVAAGFFLTGAVILMSQIKRRPTALDFKSAFTVGLAQAVSIVPGVSRSGSTIVAGMMLGLGREEAARFSFLISIPVILGAALVDAEDIILSDIELGVVVVAVSVSFSVGYLSLKLLWHTLSRGRLYFFSYYCFTAAFAVFVYQLLG